MTSAIIATYQQTESIKATARKTGVSEKTVLKALVSAGIHPTEQAERIASMRDKGLSADQIADQLGITRKSVECYLPYARGSYTMGEKTANARKIAAWRKRNNK